MRMRKTLWIILGFRGVLLRDTLAMTARGAKAMAIEGLDWSEYERGAINWTQLHDWGWRCVRVSISYDKPKS